MAETGAEAGQNNTGAMIAYFLAAPIAEDLAAFVQARTANTLVPDSLVAASDYHCTIAYFGDANDLSPNDITAIKAELAAQTANLMPLSASINGVTRFVDADPNALVLNFDCPGLAVLRQRVILALRDGGIEPVLSHGFSPHISIAYIPEETLTPDLRFTPIPCVVDCVTLTLGNERYDYPLVGEVVVSETAQPVAESVPADASDDDYAYVPDGGNKSERKLYIGDATHLAAAITALAPGGFRGQRVEIPPDAKAGVMRRIKAKINALSDKDQRDHLLERLKSAVGEIAIGVSEFRLSTPDFTFKGAVPDVPLAPGVDYDALIAIPCPTCAGHDALCQQCSGTGSVPDPHPLFVVRPLGILNAVSDNGLRYDQELLNDIREQILTKKPSGRQGHVSADNSSWEFPDDVSLWVGAAQISDTLFGKAFIYNNIPFHQMVIKRKAAGSTLSNSIYGKGVFETNPDGTQRLRELNLESIDFAPAERAALQDLGGKFETTTEMIGVHEMAESEITPALIKEHLGKMKPEDVHELLSDKHKEFTTKATLADKTPASAAKMLPEGHLDAMTKAHVGEMDGSDVYEMLGDKQKKPIADAYCKEFGQTMTSKDEGVAEMGQQKAMQKQIAELQQQNESTRTIIAEYQRREYEQAIDTTVDKFVLPDARVMTTQKGKEIVASLKTNFRMHVVAQMAGSTKAEDLQAAAERAWPMFKPLAEMSYAALSGPSVTVSANGSNKTAEVQRATPDQIKRAQAEMGLGG